MLYIANVINIKQVVNVLNIINIVNNVNSFPALVIKHYNYPAIVVQLYSNSSTCSYSNPTMALQSLDHCLTNDPNVIYYTVPESFYIKSCYNNLIIIKHSSYNYPTFLLRSSYDCHTSILQLSYNHSAIFLHSTHNHPTSSDKNYLTSVSLYINF